ncbi:MAG: sulfite exporter TauE/SafE family protein [Proteobacteria bacterium]|nr:sulfite exporter TauE/SafE family protein [Pseudomonadota bacterium]
MIPHDLPTPELAIAILVAGLAGIMRGYAGFGSAIALAPVFSLLFGPALGVTLVCLLEIPVSAQLLPGAAREVQWREVAALAGPASLALPLGAHLLVALDPVLVKRVIGAAVLLFSLVMLAGWRYHGPRPLPLTLAVSFAAGVLKGVAGMAGPPVILYLLAGPDAARRSRATLIVYFAVVNAVVLLPFWYNRLITARALWLMLLILPVFMGSVWAGSHLFARGGERHFRRIALLFLIGVGLVAVAA